MPNHLALFAQPCSPLGACCLLLGLQAASACKRSRPGELLNAAQPLREWDSLVNWAADFNCRACTAWRTTGAWHGR
jgi:hypothetical protein